MARIESTGRYMPENIVKNETFSSEAVLFETLKEYLTGYSERRHADIDETGISMAVKAAEDALLNSKYVPEDIDLIIGGIFPSSNLYGEDLNLVQHGIGAMNASVLPVNTTCSTFISALNIADSLIAAGKKSKVLVVTAVNWINTALNTEELNFAFAGDGAAAVILDAEGESLIDICERNNSTPEVFESMVMKSPVFTGEKEYFTVTEPKGVSTAKDLILKPISVAEDLLKRNKELTIDRIIMHQSGLKMMQMWIEKLGQPFEKVCHTLELFANMTASNIPVSLDYGIKTEKINRGDIILFFTPAAGGHYIAMLWKY